MTNPVISATPQTTTAPGLIGQILNTLLNPAAAMAAVPQQSGRHFWLLAIQLLLTTAIIYWFYAGMSPAWLVDQQLLHAGELTPAETEQIRAAMASMAGATPIIGAVSVAVGSLAFTAITAGYLLLTGKLQKVLNYGQWFALVVWSQLPALLNILGLALLVLLADSPDQPMMLVNYASLNQLVLDLPIGHALYNWAESINVFLIWQLWILFAGLQSAASFHCQTRRDCHRHTSAADLWLMGAVCINSCITRVSQQQLKDFAMTDVSNAPATAVTATVTATTPWRRLLIAAVILATIAGVTMYRKQTQALDVQVSAVTKGDLTDSILASGNLVYRTQVALRSELMARVDAVFVQEGDKVEAGQLLLQLDPQSYRASLEQARAQTARARTDIQMASTRLQKLRAAIKTPATAGK